MKTLRRVRESQRKNTDQIMKAKRKENSEMMIT